MRIELKRIARKDTYTIGKMYINGVYVCDTIEDKDRGLKQGMPEGTLRKMKVFGETAIPVGTYTVKWTFSHKFGKFLPEIINVPPFSGIRIHSGNTAKDSLGCVIIGENKVVGKVINSRVTCDRIFPLIEAACKRGEQVYIVIS